MHGIFARFGVPEQLYLIMERNLWLKNFQLVTTALFYQRSNRQVVCSIDMFKRALRKADESETEDKVLQQFLSVYKIIPNQSTTLELSPVELMFARKIRSVFYKLILNKNKKFKKNNTTKFHKPGKKIYFKEYKKGKVGWKEGIIEK